MEILTAKLSDISQLQESSCARPVLVYVSGRDFSGASATA